MSTANGVIRVGRKGKKLFAFGDGDPFEVDVVRAFQKWSEIDDTLRPEEEDAEGLRIIPLADMPRFHDAAVAFVKDIGGGDVTPAEALDFLARLREQYDELADFFRPKLRPRRGSPDSSEAPSALVFSEEAAN